MNVKSLITAVMVCSLVLLPNAFAEDQETTVKQRNPDNAHHADQNAQVTLGGAKTFVTGEIQDIQGEHYFVRDEEGGGQVRLLVNKDTNLDCSAASTASQDSSQKDAIAKRQSMEQQAPEATERQREQGQRPDETAMGTGFRIGNCAFKRGDRVKAEVDDNGRVTMLKVLGGEQPTHTQAMRPMGDSTGTGELAIPGRQAGAGQLDMTITEGYPQKQYAILPVPFGEFKVSKDESLLRRPVKDADGNFLGSIDSLLMDSDTGQIEYAVVLLKETKDLQPVPWPYFSVRGKQRDLVLNTKEYQLFPEVTGKEYRDQSPALTKLLKDMQIAKAPAELRDEAPQKPSQPKPRETAPEIKGTIIRGSIQKIDGDSNFLVKDLFSGKDVRMRVDKQTKIASANIRDESFKEGDKVEAYVTPDGHAFSLSLMRTQGGMPDDPEAGA
jgi:Ni/Co efflux regulator RcnB